MNISYEEFKEKLLEDARNIAREILGPDAEVTIGTASVGEPVEVLCIRKKISETGETVKGYCNEFRLKDGYEKYLKRQAWAELLRTLKNHLKILAELPRDADYTFLEKFETAKEHLGIGPVTMKGRKKSYGEMCVMMDDIPMAVFAELPDSADGKNIGRLPKSILEYWGVSEEEVLEAAVLNQMAKDKPVIRPLWEIMKAIFPIYELIHRETQEEHMWVASTENGQFGSVVMVYPGFLDKACEDLGEEGIFVIPSSIHEVILLKESEAKGWALRNAECVKEVNMRELLPEEVLSDRVYHYERATQTFESVGAWNKRMDVL